MPKYKVTVKVTQHHFEAYELEADDEVDASGAWDIDGKKVWEGNDYQDITVTNVKEVL